MENEIKVNEYARDDFGNLYVVLNKYERGQFGEICVQLGDFRTKEFVVEQWERHLKIGKIIDLIKGGDYVNGYKVISILDGFANGTMEIELSNHTRIYRHHIEDIETVVTKEQFESISYKVKTD